MKHKDAPRRDPGRLLSSTVMVFYFSAFLLLALKDFAWQGFVLALAVPVMISLGTNFLPRLFPADKLLLSLTNFLCALGVLVLYATNPGYAYQQALYYGVGRWNEFFNALIYVSNVDYQPLQLVLRSLLLQSQQAVMDAALTDDPEMLADAARLAYMAEAMKYAIIFIAAAPLLIAYPFVQKHFVRGVMIGALKG